MRDHNIVGGSRFAVPRSRRSFVGLGGRPITADPQVLIRRLDGSVEPRTREPRELATSDFATRGTRRVR